MSTDELEAAGMARMTDGEIRQFLANQRMGVLGLPAEDGPYMLPMSFGFDGESTLYFTFFLGSSSRKEELTERATAATFLVFDAKSMFTWQSALLAGTIEEVPDDERERAGAALEDAWRPELFDSAELTRGVRIFAFRVDEFNGLKHTGLPPALDPDAQDD
jgi:nitroimidazol reductase NimA-like FMN-containing flavoprotein (pyridoxamine 5'-phosphate oxidase superfamily)